MINGYRSKLAVLLIGLFLIFLFYQSINSYKVDSKELPAYLTDIQLSSHLLSESFQFVHSGRMVDYDALNSSLSLFKKSVESLELNRLSITNIQSLLKSNYSIFSFRQEKLYFSVENLKNLMVDRDHLIEDFKSAYSVYRNSEIIIIQLIGDMYEKYKDDGYFINKLRSLEVKILYEMNFHAEADHRYIKRKTNDFFSEYKNKNKEIYSHLQYINNHINSIIKNKPVIRRFISDELDIANAIQLEVDRIKELGEATFLAEDRRALAYSVVLILLSLLVVLVVGYQMHRIALLNEEVYEQNESLEEQVLQRTKTLEEEKLFSERVLKNLARVQEKTIAIINNIEGCVYEYNLRDREMTYVSSGVKKIWGFSDYMAREGKRIRDSVCDVDKNYHERKLSYAIEKGEPSAIEYRVFNENEEVVWVREIVTPLEEDGEIKRLVGIFTDITESKMASLKRKKIEEELAHAQKLESVGMLAAGVAHEINTPAQFISDNLVFLKESVGEVLQLVKNFDVKLNEEIGDNLVDDLVTLIEEADMPYLYEEVPLALEQSCDGIANVAKIVRAMKDYSHPGESFALVDINSALESTITVSSSEWKYFAKMETRLDESIPLVECISGDINQVVLNMIVNAAHAIVEKYNDANNLEGEIIVQTKSVDDEIYIEITDNGKGMTQEVKRKVFDQFFTTKGVGKGTGQGLSIAHRLIVERHSGKIEVDSEIDVGTTFRIILPVKQLASQCDGHK